MQAISPVIIHVKTNYYSPCLADIPLFLPSDQPQTTPCKLFWESFTHLGSFFLLVYEIILPLQSLKNYINGIDNAYYSTISS